LFSRRNGIRASLAGEQALIEVGGKSWRKIEGKLGLDRGRSVRTASALIRSFAGEELLAAAISD